MSIGRLGRASGMMLLASMLCLSGCGNRRSDFLVVASADCQGYLDPCG